MSSMTYLILYLLSLFSISAVQGWKLVNENKYYKEQIKNYATAPVVSDDKEKWIEQPLDHFNEHEKRTWKMRYLENLEFWKEGGPIYLMIGGEMSLGMGKYYVGGSYMENIAYETNGAAFTSEHRYYGKSIPLNMSVVDNLKYLSSEQALADLAHLIRTIKSSPKFKNSKVAVFGCSYPGNLAAWMRVKYPDIVDAAWASSGPILAKKDYYEYLQTLAKDFKRDYPEDYEKTVRRYARYNMLLQTTKGLQQLKKEENICEDTDMADPLNKATFIFCKVANENIEMVNNLHKEQCQDYQFKHIDKIMNWVPRNWFYQLCTEFGYFSTSKPPFTNYLTVDFYTQICSLYFGPEFNEKRVDEGIAYTNKQYGGLTPNVTKVAYVYGDRDPWRSLGILKNLSDDAVAKVYHGGYHCQDFMPSKSNDSTELMRTRKYVTKLIKTWLGIHK